MRDQALQTLRRMKEVARGEWLPDARWGITRIRTRSCVSTLQSRLSIQVSALFLHDQRWIGCEHFGAVVLGFLSADRADSIVTSVPKYFYRTSGKGVQILVSQCIVGEVDKYFYRISG